jgi:starch phosphorylase
MAASPSARPVHLLAAEAGSDRAGEMAAGLRAAGHTVRLHVLGPPGEGGGEGKDEARLRAELALFEGAVREALVDGGKVLLADERGALAVPQMLQVLIDEQGLGWDEAWARATGSLLARFGCPKAEPGRPFWSVPFLEREKPRLLEILYEVNHRHLAEVASRWPGDDERRRRLSLVREGEVKRLRPGPLAVLAASRADVAAPWEGPAAEILNDLQILRGRALSTRPTPVFARSWLIDSNPPLAELLTTTLGERWMRDKEALDRLETLAFDAPFRAAFRGARRRNRERLAALLRDAAGVETDPDALVDVRLGPLGGSERPILNVLGLVREHLRISAGGWTPPAPRTAVIARTAEAAGPGGERLLHLLQAVASAVNGDERARAVLRVAVLPACDDGTARLLAAAADISNQPGTAGSGASGARALGFAVNGALTLGTRDGTVRELEEAVGAESLFLFGLGPLETHAWREGHVYRPQDVYAIDPLVRLSLDALVGPRYAPSRGAFDWVRRELLDPRDPWLVLADLGAYIHRQDDALAEFADPRAFTEKAILTVARARRFWVEKLELEG